MISRAATGRRANVGTPVQKVCRLKPQQSCVCGSVKTAAADRTGLVFGGPFSRVPVPQDISRLILKLACRVRKEVNK